MTDKTITERVYEFEADLRECVEEGRNIIDFIDENHTGDVAEELKNRVLSDIFGLDSNFDKVKTQQLVDDVAVAIKHENIRDKSVIRHYKRHLRHVSNKLSLLSEDEKSINISDFYIDWLLHALERAEMLKAEDRQTSKENLKGE